MVQALLNSFKKTVSRQPKYWTRTIKGILSLTKLYSNDVIEKSCTRALAFELAEYQAVKRICKNSAYALPLEEAFL